MSIYKEFIVARSTGEVLESFSTEAAANEFMQIMKKRGEVDLLIKTDYDQISEDEQDNQLVIDGLTIEDPDVEFGDELSIFDEDESDLPQFDDL